MRLYRDFEESLTTNPVVFDKHLGVILLDAIFQSFLLGIVFSQAARYWYERGDDALKKKAFVLTICLFTFFQTVIENVKAWWVLVNGRPLFELPIYFFTLWLNGMVITLCQAYFIRRCWKMTGYSPWFLYPLCTLLALTTIAILYYSVNVEIGLIAARSSTSHLSPWAAHYLHLGYDISITFWIFGCLAVDTVVASIMTVQLLRARVGVPESDSAVRTVIYYAWETAFLPQLCMLTAAIIFHAHTENTRYNLIVLFITLGGKFYVYMLLWTLNSRDELRILIKSHDVGRVSVGQWSRDDLTTRDVTTLREPMSLSSCEEPRIRTHMGEIPPEEFIAAGLPVDEPTSSSPVLDGCEKGRGRRAY